jgi:hypothetical protein
MKTLRKSLSQLSYPRLAVWLALAAARLLGCADAEAAVDPGRSAVLVYKRESAKHLSALKAALKAPAEALAAVLPTLPADLQTNEFDGAQVEALGPSLEEAYIAMEQAVSAAWDSNGNAGKEQMLIAVGEFDPEFDVPSVPSAFYAGSGGARDRFAGAMMAAVNRSLSAPRRSASRAVAAARRLGIGLNVQLFAPGANANASLGFNEGAVMAPNSLPVSVEYLVAGSNLAIMDDGVLLIGGQYDPDAGALKIVRTRASSATTTTVIENVTPTADQALAGHWSALMGGGFDGLSEGNYLLTIQQGGVPVTTITIGVP